jgi:hypothetical protein
MYVSSQLIQRGECRRALKGSWRRPHPSALAVSESTCRVEGGVGRLSKANTFTAS